MFTPLLCGIFHTEGAVIVMSQGDKEKNSPAWWIGELAEVVQVLKDTFPDEKKLESYLILENDPRVSAFLGARAMEKGNPNRERDQALYNRWLAATLAVRGGQFNVPLEAGRADGVAT